MGKYSMKVKGKEIGPAEIYAPPHDMSGKDVNIDQYLTYTPGAKVMEEINPGVGMISKGNYNPVNPYGTGVMRGYGAATKGRKISGKMG